jgi:hypothetical protein
MASEMEELFATGWPKRSTVEKHADRVRWLEEHLSETLDWLGLLDERPSKWRVEPLLVVDTETMTSHVGALLNESDFISGTPPRCHRHPR